MNILLKLAGAHAALSRVLDNFRSVVLLATRLYLGWALWTLGSPAALACAAFIVPGMFTRVGALGALVLFAITGAGALEVQGALTRSHLLLLSLPLVLTVSGAGQIAFDAWLDRRLARRCRPFMAAPPA